MYRTGITLLANEIFILFTGASNAFPIRDFYGYPCMQQRKKNASVRVTARAIARVYQSAIFQTFFLGKNCEIRDEIYFIILV